MKAICEGRKTRREVVEESLNQYRDVYLRVQQQLPKLHDVSSPSLRSWNIRLTFAGCSEICVPRRPRWREVEHKVCWLLLVHEMLVYYQLYSFTKQYSGF